MAIYVYNTATGVLVSYCPNDTDPVAPAATLAANGLTAVSGLPALSPTTQWSATSKTVVTVTAPVAPKTGVMPARRGAPWPLAEPARRNLR